MENKVAYQGAERRTVARHNIEVFVDINWGENKFDYAPIHNLSPKGMFIQTELDFSENQTLLLRFPLPHRTWIYEITSRVVWSRNDADKKNIPLSQIGYGVVFIESSEEDRKQLADFFAELPKLNLDFMKMLIDSNH